MVLPRRNPLSQAVTQTERSRSTIGTLRHERRRANR